MEQDLDGISYMQVNIGGTNRGSTPNALKDKVERVLIELFILTQVSVTEEASHSTPKDKLHMAQDLDEISEMQVNIGGSNGGSIPSAPKDKVERVLIELTI